MKITLINERPSAFTAACAHAHAHSVGRPAVPDVSGYRWRPEVRPVAFNHLSMQHESVLLQQDAQVRFLGTSGLTAKTIGMAQSPSIQGVDASGVPPRGRPV